MSEFGKTKNADKDLLKKIFDKIYNMAFCGLIKEGYNIPYEPYASGEIQEIRSKIYDIGGRIAFDIMNEKFTRKDFDKLNNLDRLYDKLSYLSCYKTFLYGVFLNLHADEESKDLFMNKNSESIARKLKLIADFIDKEEETKIKRKISQTVILNTYKEEWLKIQRDKVESDNINGNQIRGGESFFSKIKRLFR